MKEKLLKIINHYGLISQLKYMSSEQFELIEAIVEYRMAIKDNEFLKEEKWDIKLFKRHIIEELADNLVMLKQIQYYLDITDKEIEEVKNYKIERQLKRIEEEKNKEDILNKCMIEGNKSLDKLDAIKNLLEENKDLGVAEELDYMVIRNKILEIIGDKSE